MNTNIAKPGTRRYLEILRADIARTLTPELSSPRARMLSGMMDQLLGYLAARDTLFDEADRTRAATIASLTGSEETRLRRLMEAEEAFDSLMISGTAAGRDAAYRMSSGARSSESDGEREVIRPTPERLTACMRRHLPGSPQIVCAELEPIPGGFSKDTLLATTTGAPGLERLVVRMDQAVSSLGYTVVDEYPLIVALHRAGLPVPEPVLCETDTGTFGQPFIVTQRVLGTADQAVWEKDASDTRRVALQLAEFLARLHSQDASVLPVRNATRPGDEVARDLIVELERIWRASQLQPNPLMEAVFSWLHAHHPAPVERPVLVHADAGLHNVMVHKGELSAVLDWEFAHVGDSAEDLSYTRAFIEPIMPFQEFLAAYHAAGGQPYDESRNRFYRVLSTLRVAVGCYALLAAVEAGAAGADSKMAFVGTMYARRFLIDAAQHALAD